MNRVDGRQKVTGAAEYGADHDPDRLAHGYLLLSTIAHGTISAMDTASARRADGVLAVYTPFEPLTLHPDPSGLSMTGQNWVPLADTQVRYRGQVIGLVVAETFEQARAAAIRVATRYDALPVAASLEAGIPGATAAPPLFGEAAVLDRLADGVASIDDALAGSDVTVSAGYSQPIKHHAALEPHSTVAAWSGDRLTVHGGTQSPTGHAQSIATSLGVDVSAVHVISPHIGGGFGGKAMTWAYAAVTAAAARDLGRPVKTVLTREQTFTIVGHRSAVRQTVALGASRDGTLTAMRHVGHAGMSTSGGIPEFSAGLFTRVLYPTPNLHAEQLVVTMDVPPCTIMRAPGEESGSFAVECALDELAEKLGMDPIDLRSRNYATVNPASQLPWSGKHLDECYRVGAARFGWSRRPRRPGTVHRGEWSVGMGMASTLLGANRFPAQVRIRLRADGAADVDCATADLGTGMWTMMTMTGAETLGIPVRRIRPRLGDSTLPFSLGVFGSSGTASVTSAVVTAAGAVTTALIEHAVTHERSPLRGLDPAEVTYREGALVYDGGRIGFGELLTVTGTDGVEATGADQGGDPATHAFHSFGAHFCEVRVNRFTGEPRLTRITTVVDAGRIINPKTARSQVIGGVTMGIGHALTEGARLEARSGRIANANLADYLIPVNADVPPVDVHFLQYPDTVFHPLGARGIGEVGTVGIAAAIANAVYNATGIRVRDLPITVDKLLG